MGYKIYIKDVKSIALYATAMRCQYGANANLCDANG